MNVKVNEISGQGIPPNRDAGNRDFPARINLHSTWKEAVELPGPNDKFVADLLLSFFVALGVVVGGSLMSGVGTLFTGSLPLHTMYVVSQRLKLWGTIAALGGTFATFHSLESSLFSGQPGAFVSQVIYIVSAFTGGHVGYILIRAMTRG